MDVNDGWALTVLLCGRGLWNVVSEHKFQAFEYKMCLPERMGREEYNITKNFKTQLTYISKVGDYFELGT
jgi:hypothetical protein